MLKYDHFTKTGSGQSERKLQNQRPVFVQNLVWLNGHNHYHHNGLSNIRRFHTDVRNGDDSSPGSGSEEVKTAAAAAAAPGGCSGGPISAAEFERVHAESSDASRNSRKHTDMMIQNSFAAVGAGPNRFILGWDS